MKTLERVQEPNKIPVQAPAVPPKRIMAATNVFVRFLLRSPLHFLLSNALLLLTYTGRKSGKRYTNPLPYMREGEVATVFTYRSWWKNVRGGAPVLVEIKRQRMSGIAEAISEEKAAIATSLLAFLTMRGFRKEKNMRLNPKVTLLCYDPRQPLRFLEVRGMVVEMTEAGALEHLDGLCELYTGTSPYFGRCVPADLHEKERPVLCKILPTHVVTLDARRKEVVQR